MVEADAQNRPINLPSRTMTSSLQLTALQGIPMIGPGDDLGQLVTESLASMGMALADQDILVMAQKIVSKSENRLVRLDDVTPSPRALELALATGKPAALVEVILSETRRIVRVGPNLLIVEDRRGFVCANAGVDQSNVRGGEDGIALLLPEHPDRSAERLKDRLRDLTGRSVAVVINDSFGRPWRMGTMGVAVGSAGLPSLVDRRGDPDLFGRTLRATTIALADEVAAAASLLMGGADEGQPVVLMRGMEFAAWPAVPAASLLRPSADDLFR